MNLLSLLFSGVFRPHLELLGHAGHVHVPTFGLISHVSGPKLTFGGKFQMILHGFWLSRTTQEALEVLKKVGAEDWLTLMHRRKWRWAEKVVNHEEPRWTAKILLWLPTEGARCVGHPKLRWLDSIQKFAASRAESSMGSDAWLYLLRDHKKAGKALPHFVHFCIHGL